MKLNIKQANKTLLQITDQYQNIPLYDLHVPVPYFINIAELIYKQAMKDVEIETNLISKTIEQIKEGKTGLGSHGGKGSPQQITDDLQRTVAYINHIGYSPKTVKVLRAWMATLHVGLDCSGYIYNIIIAIEKSQRLDVISKLAWTNPESKKPSHAGVHIFDSNNLKLIDGYSNLQPMDLVILNDHSHIGIVAEQNGRLVLAECSMGENGITFKEMDTTTSVPQVTNGDSWNRHFKEKTVKIRRLSV